jgi:hypothetical protein
MHVDEISPAYLSYAERPGCPCFGDIGMALFVLSLDEDNGNNANEPASALFMLRPVTDKGKLFL